MDTPSKLPLTSLPLMRRVMVLAMEPEAMAARAADGDGRIPITLSSDSPVARYFGNEILDHTSEAVDLSYARDGLPFLVNHDTDRQVGLLEDVQLRADGKIAAEVRFSRSPAAQEIRQDMLDGIRKNISVGYRIDAMKLEETSRDGVDTYRATRWTPMEGSTVPVPADITVGVGRDAERAAFPVVIESSRNTATATGQGEEGKMGEVQPTPAAGVVGVDRQEEAKFIGRAAEMFGMQQELPRWIAEGKSLSEVREDIERINTAKAKAVTPPGHVDLSPREEKQYNILRAFDSLASGNWHRAGGFEKEISDAVEKRLGKAPRSLYIPLSIRAALTGNLAGTSSVGLNAVETQLLPLIEILRNQIKVRQLGATVLSGLVGNLAIPRQLAANTLSWTGEDPSTANTFTALTLEQITLSPKTAMASTAYSRQAAIQVSPDVSNMVLSDLASVVAIGIDAAALMGTGASNQPTGVYSASGTTARAIGTNGGNLDWANAVGYETDYATYNADTIPGSPVLLTSPGVRGKAKQTLKTPTYGSIYLWEGAEVNGYRAEVTNQLPTNVTKGTSTTICHAAIFGNWSQLLIGEWGGALDVLIDPYTYATQNMIAVHAFAMVDVAVRLPRAFVVTKDLLVT